MSCVSCSVPSVIEYWKASLLVLILSQDKMLRTIRLWAEKQLFEDTDVTRQLQKLVDEKKTPEKPRKVKEEVRVTPMEVVEKLKKTKESWEDEPDVSEFSSSSSYIIVRYV